MSNIKINDLATYLKVVYNCSFNLVPNEGNFLAPQENGYAANYIFFSDIS